MEVSSVRPCRNEQNYDSAVLAFIVALLDPFADVSAVGRIAENHLLSPRLLQAVIFRSEEILALCRFWQGARIQREVKFLIQLVEEVLWRGPVHLVA